MDASYTFNYGIKIDLKTPDSFNVIKETLTRVGIKSAKSNTLTQTCHILHKRGDYFILHFLELFGADGKESHMEDEDYRRRNAIAMLLVNWGLCELAVKGNTLLVDPETEIFVLPYKSKKDWTLVSKYTVGKK